ncbi:MAG: ABC transporter permease [Bryobacteraceae bacterium]|nr:ABC transporter permease [Bryobacteraceae bacterium]
MACYRRNVREFFEDLAHSFRLLRRQPAFTIAAIALLAMGIGLTTGIFSVVNAVLLRPLPFRDPERICNVWTRNEEKGQKQSALSAGEFLEYREQTESFSAFSAYRRYRAVWTDRGVPSRVATIILTEGYLEALGVQPAKGRGFARGEFTPGNNNVVVLSDGFWTERLGRDPAAVGKAVVLDGEPHTVVGILPPVRSEFTSAEVYAPLVLSPEEIAVRSAKNLYVVARLKPGVTREQAQAELAAAASAIAERHPASGKGWTAFLVEAKEELIAESRQPIMMLFGAVCLVLLIACANLANLFLARLSGRRRDIAVRSAMGASQGRIFRQLLFESLWVALLGGAGGLGVAYGTLKAVVAFTPAAMPRLEDAELNPEVLIFAVGLSLGAGLVFGSGPALNSLRMNLADALRDESRSSTGGKGRSRSRSALVVAEVALSAILLVCAGLLTRTLQRLAEIDLGFRPDGAMTARLTLPSVKYREEAPRLVYVRRALERLRAIPGVEAAGVGTTLPMQQVNWLAEIQTEDAGEMGGERRTVTYHAISPGFLSAIGSRLLAGRDFTEADGPASSRVLIVNREFERVHMGGGGAVGRGLRVKVGKHDFRAEIVGVVDTIRQLKPEESPRPAIYEPHAQNPWPFLAFAVRAKGGDAALSEAMRRALLDADPDVPTDRIMPLANLLGETLKQRRLAFGLLTLFGALAAVLSLVGLYAVLAISVSQRRREIGIRMAMGAKRSDITGLVLRQGGMLAATGLAAGLMAAPLASKAMDTMLVGITPADPVTYAAVAVVVLVASLAASFVPAWRGSRVDPLDALREV